MPVLTFRNLLTGRPALRVFVGVPAGWNEARAVQGLPAVYPLGASALIDTGAARSLIAASLVNHLGLPLVGDAPSIYGIGLGGRPVPAAGVAVSLTFADGPPVPAAEALSVCAVPDEALGAVGLEMILGRDFLARFLMVVYNGPEDRLTLAF
jgi:hypothetical protein